MASVLWAMMWVGLVTLLLVTTPALPSTHWLVTETGKIEAQPDSIFHMRQPHDLVSFIHQEQRFTDMNNLHDKLSKFRGQLDDNTSLDVPDVEGMLSKEDPDCIFAGRSLTQFDLYLSTMVPTPRQHSIKIVAIDSTTKLREPVCDSQDIEGFTLHIPVVDAVPAIRERRELVMGEEAGLMPVMLEDGRIRLSQYGHSVYFELSRGRRSWNSYNLAALYWRMKGNAFESIECLRRALFFGGTKESQTVSLVSLGNVLHQSLRSDDAAAILELAVNTDPLNVVSHYTLGNVYAVLMQYNKSIDSFHQAVTIQDDLEWVKKRKAAVKCHKKLEMALEAQHTKLQNTLEELKSYQTQHASWSQMNTKLYSVQAPLESRVSSRDSYESYKLMTEGTRFRPQGCYENLVNGQKVLECVHINYNSNNVPIHSVFRRTHMAPAKEESNVMEGYDKVDNDSEKTSQGEIKELKTDNSKPTKKKRYPKLGNYNEFTVYERPGWPSHDECVTHVTRYPEWTSLPTVYLPPDNKGFDLKRMVNDELDLTPTSPHSLPWYPPTCDEEQFAKIKLPSKYANLPGFGTTVTKDKVPDENARPRFLVSFGKVDMTENLAELGARIKTVQEAGTWPPWLLHLLAGTYWRILGNTGASLTCHGLALAEVPVTYRDLVLTNLGSLLYKLGYIDESLRLVREALAICDTEPETHFFLGNLLAAKGNMTGSIEHYRAALRLEPDFPGGVTQLRVPSCYVKYHLGPGPGATGDGETHIFAEKATEPQHCHAPGTQGGPGCNKGPQDFILCRNGHCQYISKEDVENIPETPESKKLFEDTFNLKIQDKIEAKVEADVKTDSVPPPPKVDPKVDPKVEPSPVVRGHIEAIALEHPPEGKMTGGLENGAVEIATIAVTEEIDPVIRISSVPDDSLPEYLIRPSSISLKEFQYPDTSSERCSALKKKRGVKQFTSTWVGVASKGINFADHLPASLEALPDLGQAREPVCEVTPVSLRSLDHLSGVARRREISFVPEAGLREAFESLAKTGTRGQVTMERMASMIAQGLEENPKSWILSSGASLYWRVRGNAARALDCLRHALYHAPLDMRDTPLVGLANIMHRAGLYNDALIAANLALEISPRVVVTHFTLANIYASKIDLEKAKLFYISTLALQSTFEPALERLSAILCDEKFGP